MTAVHNHNYNKGSQVRNARYIVEGDLLYKRSKRGALQRASQAHAGASFVQLRILPEQNTAPHFHMFSQLVGHRRDLSTFVNNLMV